MLAVLLRRAGVLAAAVAVAIIATAAAGAVSSRITVHRTDPLERQYAILERVMSSIGGSQIARARIVAPPDGYAHAGRWLALWVRADDLYDYNRGHWQGLIVAGVLRDRSAAQDLPAIGGVTFTVVWPDGTDHFDGSSVIYRPFSGPLRRTSSARVRDLLDAAAVRADGRVTKVSFIAVRDGVLAIELTVVPSKPKEFVADLARRVATLVGPLNQPAQGRPLVEGTFVHVRDEAGKELAVSGYSVRTGHGVGGLKSK